MEKDYPSPEDAARIFLNMLIARAYNGAINAVASVLEKGPPGRRPPEELTRLHDWFESLDTENRKHVQTVIQKSVDSAVFGCLVLLDGMSGGNPIRGKQSDFAVYLQAYEDDDAMRSDSPQNRVRLNPPAISDDLHDMFHWMLQERTRQQ